MKMGYLHVHCSLTNLALEKLKNMFLNNQVYNLHIFCSSSPLNTDTHTKYAGDM
jgi:hypothetical protein